jgi:hypothetical protein
MKRTMALLFVVAMAFTMIAGCACGTDAPCPKACLQAIEAIKAQPCDARDCIAAAQRAEAAAARAEAAANKAESIFMKHMKK